MRYLTLIRHAKSSWADPTLRDFDRPLNDRGRRDAPRMASRAVQLFGLPDRWISSPARRALATAQTFAEALGVPPSQIQTNAAIYDADRATLVELVRTLPEDATQVWLFGHNPGFSELGHWLCPGAPAEMPTCALAQYALPVTRWAEAAPGQASLRGYLFPKQAEGLAPGT